MLLAYAASVQYCDHTLRMFVMQLDENNTNKAGNFCRSHQKDRQGTSRPECIVTPQTLLT